MFTFKLENIPVLNKYYDFYVLCLVFKWKKNILQNVLESYYLVADWVDFSELSIFINASLATLLIDILFDEANRGHGHWKKDFVRYHLYCFSLETYKWLKLMTVTLV